MFRFMRLGTTKDTVRWPEGPEEMAVTQLRALLPGGAVEVGVGRVLGGRFAFGRIRPRIHVLVGGEVQAEFVGADDFEQSGEMLSVLKQPGGNKHAARPSDVPEQYHGLHVEPFHDLIRSKRTFSSLAVVAHEDDVETTATCGLLQWLYRRQAVAPRESASGYCFSHA